MNVFIVDAKRTAIGTLSKGLATVSASEMGAAVVKDLVKNNNIDAKDINEVLVGNVLPAGSGQGVGRQVAIKSGLDESVCGSGVSMVCGSGLKTINTAFTTIKAGEANMIIAGGTESMSLSPYAIPGARGGLRLGDSKIIDTVVFDALIDAYSGIHMGVTAENIVTKYGISRESQDRFSLESQRKALDAIEKGYFKNEIIPLTIKSRKGETIFDQDEHPRITDMEKLKKLKPLFKDENGSVTAGNASGINDGAAFTLIANDKMVEKYNFKPMARIIATGQAGLDPKVMGLGPVFAIKNMLAKTNVKFEEVDLFELNEAYASQSLGVVNQLATDYNVSEQSILDKTNVCGGAIALGHPVGASGARVVTTLVHQLIRLNKRYGIASLCIGGGMGIAILVENVQFK